MPDAPPVLSYSASNDTRAGRLRELARLFTRLGFTAFGGPPAHVAMIADEVVDRQKWIDHQHFLDILASVNFVPGPNSTELAIHIGLIRAGFAGMVTAGICFITPAMLIILPLAYLYVRSGSLPEVSAAMTGINACVVAIVAAAVIRFGKASITDRFTAVTAILATIAGFIAPRFPNLQPDLIILFGSAGIGAMYYGGRPKRMPSLPSLSVLPLMMSPEDWRNLWKMTLLFLKVGATLFGSGYLLVTYLQSGLVDQYHWLSKRELLDAIAIGQVTPGPLLTTATFIGYVLGAQKFHGGVAGGILGGVLATIGIFLPSFLFIAVLGRVLPRIRSNRYARGALNAMNAAVVAMILVVCWRLGATSWVPQNSPDWLAIGISITSLIAILAANVNPTWLILASGIIGALRLL